MAVSSEEIRKAREMGFSKKKPKMPKKKYRSVAKMEEYFDRVSDWEKDVKKAASLHKKMKS